MSFTKQDIPPLPNGESSAKDRTTGRKEQLHKPKGSGDVLSQTFWPRRYVPPFCPIFSRSVPPFCPICKNVKSGRKIEILRQFYHATYQRQLTNSAIYPYLPISITPTPMKKHFPRHLHITPHCERVAFNAYILSLFSCRKQRIFFLRFYTFAMSLHLCTVYSIFFVWGGVK